MKLNVNYINVDLFNNVKEAFDSGERVFDFEIDSMGGELFYALQIYDLLRSDPNAKVSAHVAGACMSAATIILCTAPLEARSSTSNSVFMIHSPSTVVLDQINKRSAERLVADISLMNTQIENIYTERTSIPNDVMKLWMDQEKTFNAQEALQNGFISKVDVMYNFVNKNIKNMKTMIKIKDIKNFVISLVTQLKNESFKTADGIEFETLSLEVGSPVENLEDGVYTLEDGRTITVEKGIITDVIDTTNDGDAPGEDDGDDTPGEGDGEGGDDTPGEGDGEGEGDDAVAEEKIKKLVEETVEIVKESIIAQYKPIVDLVHECGGVERLQALKNTNPAPKKFESNKGDKKRSSLEDLMNRCTK